MLETVRPILDVFQEGIVITDAQGVVLLTNSRYSELSALPSQALVGKPVQNLMRQGLFDLVLNPEIVETRQPSMRPQKVSTGRRLVLSGHPVLGSAGHVQYVVTFIRDATTLAEVQNQARLQNGLLQILATGKSRNGSASGPRDMPPSQLQSPPMRAVHENVLRVAPTDVTVLLLGETGVGKDVVARYIHEHSPRSHAPFIKVDCGALAESLIEAELFGYAEGSFSGAKKGGHSGLLEAAAQGTIFLDEVGELPLGMQTRLLRVLQDREICRVGEHKARPVDARIIAATNRDLELAVERGTFRKDLYYRLKVAVLGIPPLRKHRADILPLAHRFLLYYAEKYGRKLFLSADAQRELTNHSWPGNIRELENCMQAVAIHCREGAVLASDLRLPEVQRCQDLTALAGPSYTYKQAMGNFEYQLLTEAVRTYGSLGEAAKHLEMDRSTLFRKLKAFKEAGYEGSFEQLGARKKW